MEPYHYFIIIAISTLLSAYFTGNEIALVSVWKMRLEIDLNPESFISKFKNTVKSNPEKYIATLAIGNFFAFILSVIAFTGVFLPLFNKYIQSELIIVFLITLISATVFLLFGKLIPKTIFPFIPARFLQFLLVSLLFFSFLFYPIIGFAKAISNLFSSRLLKDDKKTEYSNPLFNRIDLNWLVDETNLIGTEKKKVWKQKCSFLKMLSIFQKLNCGK